MMTLHRLTDENEGPAQRTIEVLNAQRFTTPAPAAAVVNVFCKWGDVVDEQFTEHFQQFEDVCGTLWRLIELSDRDEAATRLNQLLGDHTAAPRLEREPGWDWHLHFDHPTADWGQWFLSVSTFAFALRLASSPTLPWGICAADHCCRAFLDRGRQQQQRYCSARCASRTRVRAHRAR